MLLFQCRNHTDLSLSSLWKFGGWIEIPLQWRRLHELSGRRWSLEGLHMRVIWSHPTGHLAICWKVYPGCKQRFNGQLASLVFCLRNPPASGVKLAWFLILWFIFSYTKVGLSKRKLSSQNDNGLDHCPSLGSEINEWMSATITNTHTVRFCALSLRWTVLDE